MSEDVSAYMRTAVTVFCSAALCAAAVNIMVMSMGILQNYTSRYTFTLTSSATGAFSDLALNEYTACPIIYCAIDQAIDSIDSVTLEYNGSEEVLYRYDTDDNNLMKLMTLYRTKMCKFRYNMSGVGGLYKITLEVVD